MPEMPPVPDSPPAPDTPTPLDGQALYGTYCADCHRDPARFGGITENGLSNAITGVPSMNDLSTLSPDEIRAIVGCLAN